MNDAIFTAKRRLTETEALWATALGTLYQTEKHQAFQAYREAVKETSFRLVKAIDEYLEGHPLPASDE